MPNRGAIVTATKKYTEEDLNRAVVYYANAFERGRNIDDSAERILKVHRAILSQAISDERERCATVADYYADHHAQDDITDRAARRVAAEIRGSKP